MSNGHDLWLISYKNALGKLCHYVLEGLRWQDVAVQVGYSERYCQELYSRSTETLWQKYENSA